MAAPNIISATTINGKTTGANLTSTSATTVLNNAVGSGKCLKVNTLNVISVPLTITTPVTNVNTGVSGAILFSTSQATLNVNINGVSYRIALYAP